MAVGQQYRSGRALWDVNQVYYNGALYTVKKAKVDLAASGDVLALVANATLVVVSGFWTVSVDTTIKFQSGGSTDLTGAMTIKSGSGFSWPPVGDYLRTSSGAKLNVVMGTACQLSGSLSYIEVG